jgi:hypothetical protein
VLMERYILLRNYFDGKGRIIELQKLGRYELFK